MIWKFCGNAQFLQSFGQIGSFSQKKMDSFETLKTCKDDLTGQLKRQQLKRQWKTYVHVKKTKVLAEILPLNLCHSISRKCATKVVVACYREEHAISLKVSTRMELMTPSIDRMRLRQLVIGSIIGEVENVTWFKQGLCWRFNKSIGWK